MPVINYPTINDVPEVIRDIAKVNEETGEASVNVVANTKLEEFRDKNIALSKQIEAVSPTLARVKDIAGEDFDSFESELKELRSIAQRVSDGELKTDDQIEQAVQDRLKVIRDGYEDNNKSLNRQLAEEQQNAKSLVERLNRTRIDKEVTAAVIMPDSGVRSEALPDVLERAYRLFKVEDDGLVPKKGESVIYGADGASPMSVSEWVTKLRDEAPHYFKGNSGGGAGGSKDDKIGGYSAQQIAQMSAHQRLELANKLGGKS